MALSNSQYDAIMRVYNQRQFQDKREQDKRIAEVYEKVPQVEALSDEIAATMAQAARKILAGDRAAADQLKKDAEFLKEQKAVYLKQNGYPANYLELQYVCPDCKDTGYTRKDTTHSRAVFRRSRSRRRSLSHRGHRSVGARSSS